MSRASAGAVAAWVALAAWLTQAARTAGPVAAPPLGFAHAVYNMSIPENSAGRTYAMQPPGEEPAGLRLPLGSALDVRYRIRAGDKDKFFRAEERHIGDFVFLFIRTRTGNSGVLNRERKDHFRLEVRATTLRGAEDGLEAEVVVHLTVIDSNDLDPLFYPLEYSVVVPEDLPVHASVARVSAEDADLGINGDIYYSFAEWTEQFAVHPTSGVVTLTRPLIYAEQETHELKVLAQDRGARAGAGRPTQAPLAVRVRQVNLHAPVLYVHHLPDVVENSSTEIYAIVQVRDEDEGAHGQISSLDIVDGDPDGHFRIESSSQTGEYKIVVHRLLDRERTPQGYNLTLRAMDKGTPQKQSYKSVTVRLADSNDNAPIFSKEIYEVNVPETVPINTPLIRLKVTDRDDGVNARVSIEIVGGNEGGEFAVNADTGMLYTAVPLDAEQKAIYTLTVSAVDQGNVGTRKQSSAKVKINVIDTNDNDPIFERSQMEVTINENEPTGRSIAKVLAKDKDSGENAYVSYSIANLNAVPFEIDHFSGVVKTTQVIDYESMRREFVLRVRASDWGLPYRRQTEMQLTIKVQDVNDNRPQFEKVDCMGYIPRYFAVGTEIITLSAIDFDAGNIISYRIISGNDDNCFNLESTTGVLSLGCDLKELRVDERAITVTATDGTHFADSSVIVFHLVNGKNTSPGNVFQNEEMGSFDCKDTGVARRLTEIIAAAERNNMAEDGETSGEHFAMMPSRYGENVHSPEFMDFPIEIRVNESVSLGTSLVRLRARDKDLGYNGKLVYSISGGDRDSVFRIDPEMGDVEVIGYLDHEREIAYLLNITVYDLGTPQKAASKVLPVTVLDVNDNAPRFEKSLASFRVTENALNGTTIFVAHATDRDSGAFSELWYSLATDTEDFCVEAQSGALVVCAPLDRERQSLYELVVRAFDRGGLYSDALVRVEIDDINDNAPQFSLPSYSVRVREDVPRGTVVACADAIDSDLGAGGRVHYMLVDDTEEGAFVIDAQSGVLRTARGLDYEERQTHALTVRATDGGRPALWAEATVLVEVLDVDENRYAPVFPDLVLQGAVRENRPPGARVLAVNASDADPPGGDSRLAYTIVGGSGLGFFAIDDLGVIRTVSPLDAESAPHYWLTVCAQDHGAVPQHACVQVWVRVEDENDNVPLCEAASYTVHVQEHAPAGTPLLTLVASDPDPGPDGLTYRIVAGNPDGLFSIDSITGVLSTTGRRLDRELAEEHALEVLVSDSPRPALSCAVRVLVVLDDINDHAPRFLENFYSVRVPAASAPHLPLSALQGSVESGGGADDVSPELEGSGELEEGVPWGGRGAGEGDTILRVLAVDPDAGENGTIMYSIKSGKGRAKFRVDPLSGVITAVRPLQPGTFYDLNVRATDGGAPARTGAARVSVQVLQPVQQSPHAPVVPAVPALAAAELDAPGFLLAVVQASDPDGDTLWYDIVDGDPERDLYVGRESGNIVVARRLLWERRSHYTLNVSVTDGFHLVYTTVNVSVVNDVNEQRPQLSEALYEAEVSESARVGDAVLTLHARGAGQLVYGLHCARSPHSLLLFKLDSLTGAITLRAPLDRESMSEHVLTVWVRDQALRSRRAHARVLVRVRDADDHAPTWGRALAQARVPRLAPLGAVVTTLQATDRDTGENGRIVYSITGGNTGGAFSIEPALGAVRVARDLDAGGRGPAEYTLQVRAAGVGPRARSSTLPLHITTVHSDASPPRFTGDATCEVAENEGAGARVTQVQADSTSSVWYELADGNADGAFRINPAAGVILTQFPLDYEARNLYNLTVRATNMRGGSATCQVVVHVADRNEHAPRFLQAHYRGRVREAQPPGTLVSYASADVAAATDPLVLLTADADSADNALRTFEILEPDAASHFTVDFTTGAVSTVRSLDYELRATYTFTVKVIDTGTPRLTSETTAQVSITVLDVNDCPPTFEHKVYNATIVLPTYRGVLVLAVVATDADSAQNQSIAYNLVDGDGDGAFIVDPASGAVTVAKPDGLAEAYALRVRASDGVHSAVATLAVRVHDSYNSGLVFHKSHYSGSVPENSTKVVTVAVLDVLGSALNEHVEFRILNPSDMFSIGATSGAVRTRGVRLDRERRAEYVLAVEARSADAERAPRVAHAALTIAVTDVNDNCPAFVNLPYYAAVPVERGRGEVIARVHAVDADAGDNGQVRYEMKRGNGELFKVDRKSGEISLKQSLEGHGKAYQLVVSAYDGGAPACGSESVVTVRAVERSQPQFSQQFYSLGVREDAEPHVPLGPALLAASPLQRQLIYTIVEGNELEQFELDFSTGLLAATERLDYEAAREHALTVRATDGVTGAHADVGVVVRVQDVNDCAPEWERELYTLRLAESTPPGVRLLTLRASDNDTGVSGQVHYSLEETDEYFYVEAEDGGLYLKQMLDRETRATHRLRLVASDAGVPPLRATADLLVEVEDVNDNSPAWERATWSCAVWEGAARGQLACHVSACDADAGDAGKLRYAIAAGNPRHLYTIHPQTGALSVASVRGLAGARLTALNVSVSDGVHSAYSRVKMTLTPANKAPPQFQHVTQMARALENQSPPQLIATVKATDTDWGEYGQVTYALPSARLRETFSIDPRSGAVTTRVPLDRELAPEYSVEVTASDGGGLVAHTTLRVAVGDENDNAPAFLLSEYRVAVSPRRVHAPFLTVRATDADEPAHAAIRYSIYKERSSDVSSLFTIQADTGALSLTADAKLYESRVFQFWVRASDGPHQAEVPVEVYVMSSDDAAPVFERDYDEFFLPENSAPGTIISELRLVGEVPAPAGTRFRLVPGRAPPDLFAVDERGRVTLAGALDRETADTHLIGVLAETGGSPPLAALAQVLLHVLDENDNAPEFLSAPYVVAVAENTPPHSSILRVEAVDADSGSNAEVRYSLSAEEEGAGELFAVDPYTGWLSTLGALDRETRAEHRLQVLATDSGQQRRVTRGSVLVRVRDYNDCSPVFTQPLYTATVPEDALPGTVVTRLELTDEDREESAVQLFVARGDPHCQFQLRATGELLVVRALDRETLPAYTLDVVATDGKHVATTTLMLQVLDANDNPPQCLRHRYAAVVSEAAPLASHVLRVEARDADEPHNARLRFYLSGDGAEHFALDRDTGDLRVGAALDRETRARYELAAHAQDRDRPEWECVSLLHITLTDVNDNEPRFALPLYSATLPEDVEVGTLVAKVHATDADVGINRRIRYSLAEESSWFRVAPDSGIVTLAAPLDRETCSSHRAEIAATDSGNPSREARVSLVLTVSDVNDNPPEFEYTHYEALVREIDAVGTEILRVAATSADTGVNADVHFAIVGGNELGDLAIHSLSGMVSIARPLDYERVRQYALTVQATDGGEPPLSALATLNITVADANDNPPVFTRAEYAATLREDARVGDAVIQVMADDADSGANGRVSYSIERGDPSSRFAVDPDTGHVTLAAPLDRELQAHYSLELQARDRGVPALSASVPLEVQVQDANDNPPVFAQSEYSAVVPEDRALGSALLRFTVSDADASPNGAPYTFDLRAGNDAGAFRLEQDGVLRTAARFNHKIRDSYVLRVRVFDNGTPPLYSDTAVSIRVIEESQYPPVITPLDILINSYLDEYPGGAVGRVYASDQDAYDTLAFSLAPTAGVPYPAADLFHIDRDTGTLSAVPRIDAGEYRLNVTVTDGKFVSAAAVRVLVELISDEMLANSIVVRFREVNDRDFVLSHRKGFVRAVRNAINCALRDVVIIAVQPAGDDANLVRQYRREVRRNGTRVSRQTSQDLDVLLAVRDAGGGLRAPDELRRALSANLQEVEQASRLEVEELAWRTCAAPQPCAHGDCVEHTRLDASRARCVATDVSALVCPAFWREARCVCVPGWTGARCDRAEAERAPAADDVVWLDGASFAQYRVEKGIINGKRLLEDELALALRFRTLHTAGTLAYAAGRIDYNILEIAEGRVQFRLELGSGEGVVRADGVRVADGAWHSVRVQRAGSAVRLAVDAHVVHGAAPGDHQMLDLRADHLYLGAQVQRLGGDEEVRGGLVGCVSDVHLGDESLPLAEALASVPRTAPAPRAALMRLARITPGCPAHLPGPGSCASLPCLNGGTCRQRASLLESGDESAAFACACAARYAGRRCELDTQPCASHPCLHAGVCSALPGGGYACACAPGLSGARCERGRWCAGGAACAHGGACEEGEWGPACRCRGYYGALCQYDVDECAGEPCENGATCVNEPGSFRCVCPPDKTGLNCGNPLHADAVAVRTGVLALLAWRWEQLAALGGAAALALALLATCLAAVVARLRTPRRVPPHKNDALLNSYAKPDNTDIKRGSKLSNLEAVRGGGGGARDRPASCAAQEPLLGSAYAHNVLNNLDTLRSYGSAGDELENMPADYRRNLNPDTLLADKPTWSDQMHLHTFRDNKIYNDLKGASASAGAPPPLSPQRVQRGALPGRLLPPDPRILGGYHWDCSDWRDGGAPELAGSARRDSDTPRSDSSGARRGARAASAEQSSCAADEDDALYSFAHAQSYLLHPDAYLPHHGLSSDTEALADEMSPPARYRDDDVGSVITMLEERRSPLLSARSVSDVSADLCEIEESDCENESLVETAPAPASPAAPHHTDV